MDEVKKFLLFFVLMIAAVVMLVILFQYKMAPEFADYSFCKDMGYGFNVDFGGNYLPYKNQDYGRVKCHYCYADGCERESFNVTRNWRGRLIKYDEEKRLDEDE